MRLSIKDPYPLAPIERCVAWIRDDSEPFDARDRHWCVATGEAARWTASPFDAHGIRSFHWPRPCVAATT